MELGEVWQRLGPLARPDPGFRLFIYPGEVEPPTTDEERAALDRVAVELLVVRGLDCDGKRVFQVYGPAGQQVPGTHTLRFLPDGPGEDADVRFRWDADMFGVPRWEPLVPLLHLNS